MTSNDHFFGQVDISSRPNEAILSLYPVAQQVDPDHFTAQLRRLLRVHGTKRLRMSFSPTAGTDPVSMHAPPSVCGGGKLVGGEL